MEVKMQLFIFFAFLSEKAAKYGVPKIMTLDEIGASDEIKLVKNIVQRLFWYHAGAVFVCIFLNKINITDKNINYRYLSVITDKNRKNN